MDSPSKPVAFGRAISGRVEEPPRFLMALKKVMSWIFGTFILTGFALWMRGSPLIDTPPPLWNVGIFASGMIIGVFFFVLADKLSEYPKNKIAMYLFGGFLIGVCFILNELGFYEVYAFIGISPSISQIYAPITTDAECVGLKNLRGRRLGVNPYSGSRRLDIGVTRSVCSKFENLGDSREDYCLLLNVETGRNSVRRVVAPVFTPLGDDRLRKCRTS